MMNKWFKKYLAVILISSLVGAVGFFTCQTRAELIFQETRQWQIASDDPDTETLRPDNAGDYQQWETLVGGDATHWEATNDDPVDDLTYIQTQVEGRIDVQNLQDPTFGDTDTVNTVTIYCRAYAIGSGGKERIAFIDRLNTTDRATGSIEITRGSFNEYNSGAFNTDPDGQGWTKTKVTNLEAGVKANVLGSETLRVSEIWIVVDYSIAASLSFAVDSASLDFGDLSPGTPITDKTSTLTVTSSGGFNIKASRDDNDTTLDLGTDATINITDQTPWNSTTPNSVTLAGTEDVLAFRVKYTGTDSSNYNSTWWGSDDADGNALFTGFPTPSDTIVYRVSASDPATDSVIQYYIDVANTQKVGTYGGGVTYTVTAN